MFVNTLHPMSGEGHTYRSYRVSRMHLGFAVKQDSSSHQPTSPASSRPPRFYATRPRSREAGWWRRCTPDCQPSPVDPGTGVARSCAVLESESCARDPRFGTSRPAGGRAAPALMLSPFRRSVQAPQGCEDRRRDRGRSRLTAPSFVSTARCPLPAGRQGHRTRPASLPGDAHEAGGVGGATERAPRRRPPRRNTGRRTEEPRDETSTGLRRELAAVAEGGSARIIRIPRPGTRRHRSPGAPTGRIRCHFRMERDMSLLDTAIEIAARAHRDQLRKGTDVPYITHPYGVGLMLARAGYDEEVIAAGILHDTVEDTDVTLEQVREIFGARVAHIVRGGSEPDKDLPWEARKRHTMEQLATASIEVRAVTCADKLHNIRLDPRRSPGGPRRLGPLQSRARAAGMVLSRAGRGVQAAGRRAVPVLRRPCGRFVPACRPLSEHRVSSAWPRVPTIRTAAAFQPTSTPHPA